MFDAVFTAFISLSFCNPVVPSGYWEWSACLLEGVRLWSLQVRFER